MKKVWITSLPHNEDKVRKLISSLKPYHIPVDGDFWVDDLSKMSWASSKDLLNSDDVGLWVIIADKESWRNNSILKGLSSLAFMVQSHRELSLPIVILTDDFDLEINELPTPFFSAKLLPLTATNLAIKISAQLNMPQTKIKSDYRINLHPLYELGLWIEIGPKEDNWSGLIVGVSSGKINFQAWGKSGLLPEKSVLEYPQQGFKILLSDTEFNAWGLQNVIDENSSYFARVTEIPDKLLFTNYTDDSDTEAYVLRFC